MSIEEIKQRREQARADPKAWVATERGLVSKPDISTELRIPKKKKHKKRARKIQRYAPDGRIPTNKAAKPKKKHLSKKEKRAQRIARRQEQRKERQDWYANEYLLGTWWKERRALFLAENPNCNRCGSSKRIQVHHARYKRDGESVLFQEKDSDLETLCRACHAKHHNKPL